jgi:hypothetical protein
MAGVEFVVTGIPETVAAFNEFDDWDIEAAEQAAGEALLPEVKSGTRQDSGYMAGAWEVKGGTFLNAVEYSPFQEFGTTYVEAAEAIRKAWEAGEDKVVKAFEEQLTDDAKKAGFDT